MLKAEKIRRRLILPAHLTTMMKVCAQNTKQFNGDVCVITIVTGSSFCAMNFTLFPHTFLPASALVGVVSLVFLSASNSICAE